MTQDDSGPGPRSGADEQGAAPGPVHVRADGTPIGGPGVDDQPTQTLGRPVAMRAPGTFGPPGPAASAGTPAAPQVGHGDEQPTQLISTTPVSTAFRTPKGTAPLVVDEAAEKRRRWPIVLAIVGGVVAVLAVVAVLLVPGILNTISTGEQIEFQDTSDEFTKALNEWQTEISQLEFAAFDTAEAVSEPYIARMESALGEMQDKADPLDGEHKKVAQEMIESADGIVDDVKAVVAAMMTGRQDEITATAEDLDKSIDAYNEAVVSWNDLSE